MWSDLVKEDFAVDYWRGLDGRYGDGGIEAVADYLMNLDLSGFDPKAPPPKTEAFWEIVNANGAPEDAELADALDDLGRPDVLTVSRVYNHVVTLQPAFAEFLRDRKSVRRIPFRFETCGYLAVRNPNDTEGRWKIRGKRETIYGRKDLTPNDRLNAAYLLTGAR